MLDYYFSNNFNNKKVYKRKKLLFFHSFSQELFFIFINFAYFNLKKVNVSFFLNNKDKQVTFNNRFFIKIMTLFLILKKFVKLKFSLKIWNSYLILLATSLNSIFLKSIPALFDVAFNINELNARSYFSNKIIIFFKTNRRFSYIIFKYFLFSMYFCNNSMKVSLLINNYMLFKSFEFAVLFFFFYIFTNKKISKKVFRKKLPKHLRKKAVKVVIKKKKKKKSKNTHIFL